MTATLTSLDEVLVQHVEQHTSRRVRNLSVEVVGEEVILRGRAASYYVKQLAQHGIRAILPLAPLRNTIVVD
jgi:hypothetical protein